MSLSMGVQLQAQQAAQQLAGRVIKVPGGMSIADHATQRAQDQIIRDYAARQATAAVNNLIDRRAVNIQPEKKEVKPMAKTDCTMCTHYQEYHGDKTSEQSGAKMLMYCWQWDSHRSRITCCSDYDDKNNSKPIKVKPMKVKNTIRAYMMGCTVAVTGKLCVLAHPLVMRLPIDYDTILPDTVAHWVVVLGASVALFTAMALLNYLTKKAWSWLFK